MMPSTYYLAEHVHICVIEPYCVFLDLRQDQYLCLERRQIDTLNGFLEGWQALPTRKGQPCPTDGEAQRTLTLLSERRMLTADREVGKAAIPITCVAPRMELSGDRERVCVNAGHVLTFFAACTSAAIDLYCQGIQHATAGVRTRKQGRTAIDTDTQFEAVQEMVAVFQTLRSWFPRKYVCIFDSLALVHFLAFHDLFPDWIFGIRMEPFEAHCWVQWDALVLNDELDYVRSFSPIMAV